VKVRALSTEIAIENSGTWDLAHRMLHPTIMRTALVLATVTVMGSVASAGTYIGLGVGTGANVSDSSNSSYVSDGRSAKLAVGFSFGRLAVEGAYSGYAQQMGDSYSGHFDSRTMQVALKYNYPLGDNFEVFGRGGLLRTDLNWSLGQMTSSGDGYTLGAGFEYRLPAFGSIFVDYTHNHASFNPDGVAPQDQTAAMWMLGINVSL
jgi:hypothetical protein